MIYSYHTLKTHYKSLHIFASCNPILAAVYHIFLNGTVCNTIFEYQRNQKMTKFKIIQRSTAWSTSNLMSEVEELLPQMTEKGYNIVSVSFGVNIWWMPTAYITISKEDNNTTPSNQSPH